MNTNNGSPKILIVDDDPLSVIILSAYLSQDRHNVRFVDNPEKVMETAAEFCPDLILLDIMMGAVSGFDVCKRLKSQKSTRAVPVIFITALSDRASHQHAIEVGGEGFLTKPYDEELVRTYVRTFLEMNEARRIPGFARSPSGELASMAIHDLNNLNTVIKANLELATMTHDSDTMGRHVDRALGAMKYTQSVVTRLHDIVRLQPGEGDAGRAPVDLTDLLRDAIAVFEGRGESRSLKLDMASSGRAMVMGEEETLRRVLLNLMDNAVKFAPPNGTITAAVAPHDGTSYELIISNDGDPIPADEHEILFEAWKRGRKTAGRERGSGLGLAFCRLAVESHGGRIWIESPNRGRQSGVAVHLVLPKGELESTSH